MSGRSTRAAEKRAAQAAPAAAPDAKRTKKGSSTSAPPALSDEQAGERAEREFERLAKEERRAAFEPYSTPALWAWGADHEGWSIPRERAVPAGRKAILDALVKGKALLPPNLKAVQKNWHKIAGKLAAF